MSESIGPIPYPEHCIYFLYKNGKVVYVGQSSAGLSRLEHHRQRKGHKKDFDSFSYIFCEKEKLDETEAFYISQFKPKYNKRRFYFKRNVSVSLDPELILEHRKIERSF